MEWNGGMLTCLPMMPMQAIEGPVFAAIAAIVIW